MTTRFRQEAERIIWAWLAGRQGQEEPDAKISDLDRGDVLILVSDLALQFDPEIQAKIEDIVKRSS